MNENDLALVGAGYWGKNLARNFHALGALRSLVDADQKTLTSYGDEYNSVNKLSCLDDALADPKIRKIAIATPATTHFRIAKTALEAGRDVYVEKPLCLNVSEAQSLIEIASANDRILMVGHLLQYHPHVEHLLAMVHAGELGKLFYITSNRLNLGKIRQEENSLWSFAPHDISVILGLVGRLPDEVVCHGGSFLTNGVADATLTQMKFASGTQAHIYVSWLNPFKEQKLTVVGSNGMAVFDDTQPWEKKLAIYRNYLTWKDGNEPTVNKGDAEYAEVIEAEPLKSECAHFLAACKSRVVPRTDGAEGMRVLQVLNAAQASLDSSGSIVSPLPSGVVQPYFAHETAVVDPGAEIGSGTKVWHFTHISSGCQIGQSCNLGQNVFIAPGVVIGRGVKIQNNVSVYTGTTIEDDVFLGPSCVLTNVGNPRSGVNRRSKYERTIIKKGATIGANATIVCGVTIGEYAFVAAGAVVTKDIPDFALCQGIPAKQVGWMSAYGARLEFDDSGYATCSGTHKRYYLSSGSKHSKVSLVCD